MIYQVGVAGNVESGAWDRLDASQRIDGFDHSIVWWLGDSGSSGAVGGGLSGLIVARMWSSVDGKGRGKYPMVVCLHAPAAEPEHTISRSLSLLEALKVELISASTQDQVRSAVDRAAAQATMLDAPRSRNIGIRGRAIAELASEINTPGARESFARTMYALARELPSSCLCTPMNAAIGDAMGTPSVWVESVGGAAVSQPGGPISGTFADASGGGGGGAGGAGRGAEGFGRGVTVRLPRGHAEPDRALSGWLSVLLTQLPPNGNYLLIAPNGVGDASAGAGGWVDLVVGDPQTPNLHCVCASDSVVPISSMVPYTLEPSFMKRIEDYLTHVERVDRIEVVPPTPKTGLLFGSKPRAMLVSAMVAGSISVLAGPDAIAQPAPPEPPIAIPAGDSRDLFNALLQELRAAMDRPGLSDDDARRLTRKFIDDVAALPGGVIYLREVDETIDALREAIAPRTEGQPPIDAGRIGPGMLSGATHEVLDAERVRFTLPVSAGEMVIEFFKVPLPGRAAPVWLSTTEVSAEQFAEIVRSFGSWDDLHRLMPPFRREEDERLGPRVWQWQWTRRPGAGEPVAYGFEPASEWLRRSEMPGAADVYAPGLDPGRPGLGMPMNHLSPDAAVYVAQLVRCRLPTKQEWEAAWARLKPGLDRNKSNLRDQTWQRQREYISERAASGRRLAPPDAGSFVPVANVDDAVSESDDGVLWFTPIGGDGRSPTTSLAGNVSEFVLELPAEADVTSPKAIGRSIEAASPSLAVAGCSALGPAVDPGTWQPAILSEAREGYADVGFRLAFSGFGEGPATLAQRLASVLDPLPLLKRAQ